MNDLALPSTGCDEACEGEGRDLFGLSLCAGAGGLDLGIHIAVPRYRTVGYVERDCYAAATLVARMADKALDCAPVWDNVADFDGKPWRGVVDIIHGGYPCQPFSVAGKKLGDKDPRHLWPHIARIVRKVEPALCFFENVGGHLRLGFEQVHDDLQSMGYRVKAGLFTAEEVGAPHKRERLFILAYRDSDGREGEVCAQPRQDDPQGSAECIAYTRLGRNRAAAASLSLQQGRSGISQTRQTLPHHPCAVANPARTGARQHQCGSRPQPERSQQDVVNAHVVNTGSAGLERRFSDQQQDSHAQQPFPPGPADKSGWEELLRRAPHLEPAVCGGIDGLASQLDYRVDRLRLCGNGVVPLVAAYALRTLCAAAGINITDATE